MTFVIIKIKVATKSNQKIIYMAKNKNVDKKTPMTKERAKELQAQYDKLFSDLANCDFGASSAMNELLASMPIDMSKLTAKSTTASSLHTMNTTEQSKPTVTSPNQIRLCGAKQGKHIG